MTIAEVLMNAAQRWGSRVALVDARRDRRWTFAQLAMACAGTGARLQSMGLPLGARVALIADSHPEYLFADYGAMSSGFVRVPLDPTLSFKELQRQIEDAGASTLLCDEAHLEVSKEVAASLRIQTLLLEENRVDPCWQPLEEEKLATLNYTGGTSSQPKAVMHTQGSLCAVLRNISSARGTVPGDVMLNVRPLWPIAAVIVLAHIAAGGTVVLEENFKPSRFVSHLANWEATCTSLVPTHLVRLLRETSSDAFKTLFRLRSIDVGAAAIPPETFEAAVDAIGPKIGVLYGLTEAPWSCYQPPNDVLDIDGRVQANRLRTAGRPVQTCEIRIDAQTAEVQIRGPHLMRGYWNQPALTRHVLRDGWFHTGDKGSLDYSGILSISGRIKETIRSGGKSVNPDEVEQVLCTHSGVLEAAVVGLPDPEWGEMVAAAVVVAPGTAVTTDLLLQFCRTQLSPHKRPKLIRILDVLPRSHYGKVQRGKVKTLLTAAG